MLCPSFGVALSLTNEVLRSLWISIERYKERPCIQVRRKTSGRRNG